MKRHTRVLLAAAALAATLPASAQKAQEEKDATSKGIDAYREQLAEDNIADLYVARGEEIWKKKRGPKNVSLEQCDLGLGPGVTKGAYAQLPRYFADTGKVMDLERRLAHCMMNQQGLTEAEVRKDAFKDRSMQSELVAYVVAQSRGMKMNAPTAHPKEREMFEVGKQVFKYRAGPYDFACETCHGEDGKRIRLQDLPNLTTKEDAGRAYTGWPAYRVSIGELKTMQWRLNDCFRQQRFPEPEYLSDVVTALNSYLAVMSNGAVYQGPTQKR